MPKGHRVLDTYKCRSKIGNGRIYLLNTGVSFEIPGKGCAFELGYDEILFAGEAGKSMFAIACKEVEGMCEIKFKSDDEEKIIEKITEYKSKMPP